MNVRNDIKIKRLRNRARFVEQEITQQVAEEFEDGEELDADQLAVLLDDYTEGKHAAASSAQEESHAWPEEDAGRFHYGAFPEMADVWMVKSGKAPLLTPLQEIKLAKRVEQGDLKAREEMINANVRLVASIARRYLGRGLPLEDLMQEGLIGLLRAVEKYNYRKGYRFSTYATHWIRQGVSRALANQSRSICLPAHVVEAISRISRTREELFSRLGRPPTRQEVAEAAGMSEKKLIHLLRSAVQPLSLDTPIGEEGEGRLGDFLSGDEENSPVDSVLHHMVREELEHALNVLTPREKEVISLRYGLSDEEPHTLEEAGRRLHITRERVRQIETKAMEKLRHSHSTGRLLEAVS